MKVKIRESVLELVEGDITREETDAIVNAANTALRGGGGVDGAIHRAGGPKIMEDCKKIGGCPTGEARITSGGRLKAKHVIHTVGPIYKDGKQQEPELLASAYQNSLKLASRYPIKTISFPSISTGVYGYPLESAARVALSVIWDYLNHYTNIETVRFVLFGEKAYKAYEKVLKELIVSK